MTPIPDAEKLVGKYLRDNLDVRVVGKPPDDQTEAWVQVTMLNAANDAAVTPDYLITYFLQCDCYAGADRAISGTLREPSGQPEAIGLGGTVRELLDGAINQTLLAGSLDAVVTNVEFTNMARIPDTLGFEPARERIVLDAQVTMHRGTL